MAEIPTFQAGARSTPTPTRGGSRRTRSSTVDGRPRARSCRVAHALAIRAAPAACARRGSRSSSAARRSHGSELVRLPRRQLRRPHRLEGDRRRRATRREPQRRAARVPEGPAPEPARRDDGVRATLAPAPAPARRRRSRAARRSQAPDRVADSRLRGARRPRRTSALLVILASLAAALFWGAAHALSPGHGKTIVAAYLVGQRGTPWHAALLGLIVTATHTVGVFALGLVTLALSQFIVPDHALPVAEPRLRAARRRRSARSVLAGARPAPRARARHARGHEPPPSPRPRPRPRRTSRAGLRLAARASASPAACCRARRRSSSCSPRSRSTASRSACS